MVDDHQFHRILDGTGYSRKGYRKVRKGAKKRLERHMRALGCSDADAYLALLSRSAEAMALFHRQITVPISRFFRDRRLWDHLQQSTLPLLVRRFASPLRIWSAGCACGEEVYSIKILCEALAPSSRPHILATDLIPERIERARNGIYPRSSLRELPAHLRDRYFDPLRGGRQFRVRDTLRRGIQWQASDIADIRSRAPFHLVLLRNNVLTYLESPRREVIFDHVAAQLAPGGCLVIGSHEALPEAREELVQMFPCIHCRG